MNSMKQWMLLLAVLLACGARAQVRIGYTNEYGLRNNGVAFQTALTHGLAVYFPQAKALQLKNRQLKGIRALFSTSKVTDVEVSVVKELGGTPVASWSLSGLTTSWKDYAFASPHTLDGEAFYLVLTLAVPADTYRPFVFDESQDLPDGLVWALQGDTWTDVSGRGYGAPDVQLLVDDAPAYADLLMKPVSMKGYYKAGTEYTYQGQVFNFGTQTIGSFDVVCQVADEAPIVKTFTDVNLAPNATYDFALTYQAVSTGELEVKVKVDNLSGVADADASDNEAVCHAYLYPADMQRRILLENFTGTDCSNCPDGHKYIEVAIAGREEGYALVSHHSGYYPDPFTMQESESYTYFFGGSPFAPGVMANRSVLREGDTKIVYEANNRSYTNAVVDAFAESQPYVGVEVFTALDEQCRRLDVKVDLFTYVMPSEGEHRLTVFLTQDSLIYAQAGGSPSYVHNHVLRGVLTATWGDAVELKAGEWTHWEHSLQVPDSILSSYTGSSARSEKIKAVLANMHLIAFVGDFDAYSIYGHRVYNAAEVRLGESTPGALSVEQGVRAQPQLLLLVQDGQVRAATDYDEIQVFDMSGRMIRRVQGERSFPLRRGFYVVCIRRGAQVVTQKIGVK